jgi:hypothetical protein
LPGRKYVKQNVDIISNVQCQWGSNDKAMGIEFIDLHAPPACFKSYRLEFSLFTKMKLFSQIKQKSKFQAMNSNKMMYWLLQWIEHIAVFFLYWCSVLRWIWFVMLLWVINIHTGQAWKICLSMVGYYCGLLLDYIGIEGTRLGSEISHTWTDLTA